MTVRPFRKYYALPAEHGSWIWLLGPYLLGAVASGSYRWELVLLLLAGLSAFLLRQPVTVLVKVVVGRRPQRQLRPALIWVGLYGLLALGFLVPLLVRGHLRLLLLAAPALPILAWHLQLVRQRAERRQPLLEILAAGELSLMAPAAYWVGGGTAELLPWLLWGLSWLQSAASILNVHLRLAQRALTSVPSVGARLRRGRHNLALHAFNFLLFSAASPWLPLPPQIPAAFALMLADATEATLRPRPSAPPRAIGLRQLVASLLFFSLVGWGYR